MKIVSKTQFQAFIGQKCPQCRKGNMFKSSTYNLLHFGDANTNCPHCNLYFEREPGFFTGAMYFSYAINVAIIAVAGVGIQFFFNPDIYVLVGCVSFATLLAMPFTFRYSRMMMMYLFSGVDFDESKAEKEVLV
ncbi:MAG: DUF983 domain-containing protein [Cytophagales bacterium]